ncbi:12557_t:CDS:2 [Dentiscutata heterogama]|uniref:12557_t:CDS:1 n=1 Tax=Dentiscutata heterogama TaxID=1316150 RepID=A0ACA9K5I3_9GLOM|nr:12557_t:CDS:2 [Dentiscutata heterogama]
MSLDKFPLNLGKMGKSLSNLQQITRERFGNADDITGLPPEYIDLEKRVDALEKVHKKLLNVTRIYANPSYDYPDQIRQSVVDFSTTFFDQLKYIAQSPAERSDNGAQETPEPSAASTQPKNLHHALARAAEDGSLLLDDDDALGTALKKYAVAQDRLGEHRFKMDSEILLKFHQPFNATLHTQIQSANKARANVKSARLSLDAAKNKFKNVRQDRIEAVRLEVEQAEDQFVAAVEEATTLMKQVIETPEPLRNLSDLVNAQLTFYQEAFNILSELVPEIDDMQVKQENLYR